ncbi:MAG: hypothetical protein ACI87J_002291 [Colwellia sp.]|jgi:hypothetical protein
MQQDQPLIVSYSLNDACLINRLPLNDIIFLKSGVVNRKL